jgi:hypothetical protein
MIEFVDFTNDGDTKGPRLMHDEGITLVPWPIRH